MTDDIFKFLVLKVIVLGSAEPIFYALYDTHNPSFPDSVAKHQACRNNLRTKISKCLPTSQKRLTFANANKQ